MTDVDLKAAIESFNDDYLKFEDVAQPLHKRRDVSAMLLLESLAPSTGYPLIDGSRYGEIWFSTDPERLAQAITPDQVRDLVRCGVRLNEGSLHMFV